MRCGIEVSVGKPYVLKRGDLIIRFLRELRGRCCRQGSRIGGLSRPSRSEQARRGSNAEPAARACGSASAWNEKRQSWSGHRAARQVRVQRLAAIPVERMTLSGRARMCIGGATMLGVCRGVRASRKVPSRKSGLATGRQTGKAHRAAMSQSLQRGGTFKEE